MPFSTDERPAFGQVWRYGSILWMLVVKRDEFGAWECLPIHWDRFPTAKPDSPVSTMSGLYDDWERRIAGWSRVA